MHPPWVIPFPFLQWLGYLIDTGMFGFFCCIFCQSHSNAFFKQFSNFTTLSNFLAFNCQNIFSYNLVLLINSRSGEIDTEIQKTSVCWFTMQMLTVAPGWDQNWELATWSRSPMWATGIQLLCQHCRLGSAFLGSWKPELEPGIRARHSNRGCKCLSKYLNCKAECLTLFFSFKC